MLTSLITSFDILFCCRVCHCMLSHIATSFSGSRRVFIFPPQRHNLITLTVFHPATLHCLPLRPPRLSDIPLPKSASARPYDVLRADRSFRASRVCTWRPHPRRRLLGTSRTNFSSACGAPFHRPVPVHIDDAVSSSAPELAQSNTPTTAGETSVPDFRSTECGGGHWWCGCGEGEPGARAAGRGAGRDAV